MIVVLDNIRSAHNVGSIFRTADAFGIEKVYLCGITPAPIDKYNRPVKEIEKTALGAEHYIPWEQKTLTIRLIKKLKREGYEIYAIEQDKKSVNLMEVKIKKDQKIALILGSETEGVSKNILKFADKIIEIPMMGQKESLNVAVTFGIVSYALTKK